MTWSRPYFGLQHKIVHYLKDGKLQLTVYSRGSFCQAYILDLTSEHSFTPVVEQLFRGENMIQAAKTFLDEQADLYLTNKPTSATIMATI